MDRGDAQALAELLEAIDSPFFRPHAMDHEGAKAIVAYEGADLHLIGWLRGVPVAYGMLRVWVGDDPVPYLGVAVRTGWRQRGHGRAMMHVLHGLARSRGARAVRLRVSPDNHPARRMYVSLGYRQVGVEHGEDLMLLDLDAPLAQEGRRGVSPPAG